MTDKARKKQTTETLESVCESLRAGISFTRSCSISGISKQTGFAWRNAGWNAIESEDADSDAPISFVAKFALETELALGDFQRPLIQRIRDGASGKGKGDWRAALAVLASRFPDEWSERTHVAKSARVEVTGQVAVEHQHGYAEYVRLRTMSYAELLVHMDQTQSKIEHNPIKGGDLDAEIAHLEARVAAMRETREKGHNWVLANWLAGKPAIRPSVIDLDETEYSEPPVMSAIEVSSAAPVGLAPNAAGVGVVLPEPTPANPHSEIARSRVQTGIGFDCDSGLAFPIFDDDEDLSL